MENPDSKRRKAEVLGRRLRRGDFAAAARLLSQHALPAGRRADAPSSPRGPMTLQEACGGREIAVAAPDGRALVYQVGPAPLGGAEGGGISGRYAVVLGGAGQRFDELAVSGGLCRAADARPEDLLLVRFGTCRGKDAMVFLIGLASYEGEGLTCRQFLARHPREEPGVLVAFAEARAAAGLIVTFGGQGGDLKRISRRAEVHRIPRPDRPVLQLDLRAEARGQWPNKPRKQLPDYSLATLERLVLGRGRRRRHRVSPAAAAEAFGRFAVTQDAAPMADVLEANRLGLLSMAELLVLFLTGCDPRVGWHGPSEAPSGV